MSRPLPFLIAAGIPSVLSAAEAAPPADFGAGLVSMLAGLAVVISMLFASLWLLRRLAQPHGAAAGMLRILATTAVGSRERIVVVEVGNSCLVLGVAPGQVTALAQIPRDQMPAPPVPTSGGFAARVKQALDRHAA